MAYSSNLDLLKEIAPEELAKLTGSPGGGLIDPERMAYARGNADGIINAYLYGRYPVPFSEPIDPLIVRLSCDLTMVNLYEYMYRGSIISTTILNRKIEAIGILERLQNGKLSLQGYEQGSGTVTAIITNKELDSRVFSDVLLDGFINE